MSSVIAWISAEAERPEIPLRARMRGPGLSRDESPNDGLPNDGLPNDELPDDEVSSDESSGRGSRTYGQASSQVSSQVSSQLSTEVSSKVRSEDELAMPGLMAHQFPSAEVGVEQGIPLQPALDPGDSPDDDRARRIYRARTVTMLRRYMRYSIDTGRLPSLLGREFFRAKVTSYTVVSFEDRVIFVHDMEKCLDQLDEFSRQIIARHILQEHDQAATGKLLHCTDRTVRTYVPLALDLLANILLEVGLLERVDPISKNPCPNSCQGGENDRISLSAWEDGKNKF